MIRRLLVPVLALAAICPLAPIAPAAGSTSLFEAEGGPVVLTGSQAETHVFEITGAETSVECAEADFAGTAEDGAGQVTLSPTYSGTPEEPASEHCSSSIGEATVDMSGCTYVLTGDTTGEDEGTDAALWVECPDEAEITVTTELATLHIPEQTPTEGGVTYTNLSEEINVEVTATGITYSCSPHFFCTLGGIPTEGNDSIYTGTTVVAGYEYEGGPANGDEFIEGKQVDIGWTEGEAGDELSVPSLGGPPTLVGEDTGTEEFSLNAGTVECSEAGYQGGADVFPASEITLAIGLSGCEAFGFANTEVLTNECAYVFHEGEEVEGEEFEGTADIECPEGKTIEIVAKVRGLLKCRATIGAQSGLSGVTYGSAGTGTERDIKITLGLEGLSYTQHTGEGLGKCEAGEFEDGKINGKPTVIGENDENEQVGVWVQPTEPPPTLLTEAKDTTLIGEATGTEEIELGAGVAECTEAGYKGTITATSQLYWSLAPEFANCEAFGFSTASVLWNDCVYEFTTSVDDAEPFAGQVAIDCPAGKAVEVIAESGETLKCRATIGSQAGLTSVTYTNSGSGSSRHYKSTLSLSGVKYAQEAGEGAGKCESGEFENGKIVGAPTVIGENAGKEQVGIWIG